MGEAKNRADDEAAERAAWADEIIADVLAIEAAAARAVIASRHPLNGEGPIRADEVERVTTLTTWGVFRSLGADVADAIDAAAGADDEDAIEDYTDVPPAPKSPLRLTTPKAAPGGILPE